MDIKHPQLEKRNFFKVYNSGTGICSFIYSVLAALYSDKLHRNVMHYKETYQKFLKNLDMTSLRYQKGSIRDIKTFLKQNKNLDISVVIYEGRLSPHSKHLQVWKYGKLGVRKREIHLLRTFNFKNEEKNKLLFLYKEYSLNSSFFSKEISLFTMF